MTHMVTHSFNTNVASPALRQVLKLQQQKTNKKTLWPQETYLLMGKTDNTHIDQMYPVYNVVTSAKEKNKAESSMGLLQLK